ncbi:hypothetical protein TNIN_34891 [Trichonephila inaurata madagascariensis]|uniref:Uncharacterized protein n=1 Tax=Trichonephila inaurata madagascariensis TaxID=2747483 RepID=A0A8X6YKR6_9ARAC|nr:hypothetical protein TNIN_34891 [Trichonephila inaurata madagascariensis]
MDSDTISVSNFVLTCVQIKSIDNPKKSTLQRLNLHSPPHINNGQGPNCPPHNHLQHAANQVFFSFNAAGAA